MSSMVRSRSLLSRALTTYLTIVVIVVFSGMGVASPASYASDEEAPFESVAVSPEESPPEAVVVEDEAPASDETPTTADPVADDEGEDASADIETAATAPADEGSTETEKRTVAQAAPAVELVVAGAVAEEGELEIQQSEEPGSPSGSGVTAIVVPGNPRCDDVCPGSESFMVDPPVADTYEVNGGTIVVSNETGTHFDWSATGIEVFCVIVKGGPNANVYQYPGGSTGDTGLHPPINPNTGQPYGLSHIEFCYREVVEEDVTKTFALTYAGAPAGATFFARYWINAMPEPDVELDPVNGGVYSGRVELPHGTTITRVDWYMTWEGEDILLFSEEMDETLHEDMTNVFEYRSSLAGAKFNDLDGDGVWDMDEPGLPGWTIEIYRNGDLFGTTVTGAGGAYTFMNLPPGSYTLVEVEQVGWENTVAPASPIVVIAGTVLTDLDFGNTAPFLGFPPELTIQKVANMTVVDPGDIITYTVTVANVGGDPALDYRVVDTFNGEFLTVVDAAGGTVVGNTITWEFDGPLAFGETQQIQYTLRVSEDMPVGTTVLGNVAVVSHPDIENRMDEWSVIVVVAEPIISPIVPITQPRVPVTPVAAVAVGEPFLPFTGGNALMLLAFAGAATATGAALRRRSRKVT